ncbi:type II secretion system F family protein [Bacillus cereus]|uniref:type II secretion system F family protein n=1 Tax=Bacillus cereus TaxID=1396 RepID=UPI000B4B834D|nr:type II secretion system F family protein [Bacillus cereus]
MFSIITSFGIVEYILIILLTVFLAIIGIPLFTTNAERAHTRLTSLLFISKPKQEANFKEGSIFIRTYKMVERYIANIVDKQIRKGNFAKLELKLKQAGNHSTTPIQFWTKKIIFAIVGSFIGILTKNPAFILLFAALGFFLLDLRLKDAIDKRQFILKNEIPDFLDLVSVTFPACANIEQTFELVCGKVDSEISREFMIALTEIKYGRKKRVVFNELALRTGIREVSSLITQINQAETFGTGLEEVLISQAQSIRQAKKELAESRGNKASFYILAPAALLLITCILVIAGPFIIQFINSMAMFQ